MGLTVPHFENEPVSALLTASSITAHSLSMPLSSAHGNHHSSVPADSRDNRLLARLTEHIADALTIEVYAGLSKDVRHPVAIVSDLSIG